MNGKFTASSAIRMKLNSGPNVGITPTTNSYLASNKLLKLGKGDTFKVGRLTGKVAHIGVHDVELEVSTKRYLVSLGKSLKDAQQLADEDL